MNKLAQPGLVGENGVLAQSLAEKVPVKDSEIAQSKMLAQAKVQNNKLVKKMHVMPSSDVQKI